MTLLPPHLSNGDVVKNGGWVPVGIQVVVGLQERTPRYPKLVKKSDKVLWIDHQSCIELGNRYACNFQLLPGLCFVCFEYLIERLFWSAVVRCCYGGVAITYLSVSRNREGAVLQFLGRQVRQNIGKVPRDVSPGSERNPLVAIAAD